MLKTQELKDQIEQLTKQNETLVNEIESMKKMIQDNQRSGGSNGNNQGGQGGQGSQDQKNSQGNGEGQSDPSNPSGQGGQGNQSNQGNQGGQSNQGNQAQGNNPSSQLADQMMKIKQMIVQLEASTSQFVSGQSNKTVTQEDMVKIVLTMMDGMIDWAFDYVKNNSGSQGGSSASGNS